MKKLLLLLLVLHFSILGFTQSVGIGTNSPDTNAILDIRSDSKGLLIPRMDSTARKALGNTKGMIVYDTTTNSFWINTGNHWLVSVLTDGTEDLVPAGGNKGDMLYWDGGKWVILPIGQEHQKLTVCNGKPKWGECTDTLTLIPQNNPNEVFIHSFTPNNNSAGLNQVSIATWTAYGITHYWRAFIKFDFSSIPANAVIQSAKLSLYAVPNPFQGNGVDAHSGSSNACYIQRVSSNWVTSSITWNNQPSTVTTNQVAIPQSTSSFQNDIDLNVTDLVKDMMTTNNYGFGIKLQNEIIYNIRQYASSFHSNTELHPKLVVVYNVP